MANIQVDDILAGTPAVQCKTKVRAPSAPTTRDPPARFLTRLANYGIPLAPEQIVCTLGPKSAELSIICLLYTSDAADE